MFFPIRDYRRSHSFPWVTVALIAVNVLVFLYQTLVLDGQPSPYRVRTLRGIETLSQEQLFVLAYGVRPCEIMGHCEVFPPDFALPIWTTLFTSMFLHGGLLHLGGNMWFLWIFGDNVEDAMGKLRYLAFYSVSGLAAAWAQILTGPDSQVPMVGASGAIAGVLGAYLLLYPHGRILTLMWVFWFIQFIELPALIVLGFWFLLQLLSSMIGQGMLQGGGVAYMAHVGGFLAGVLFVRAFVRARPPRLYSNWR